MNRLLRLAPMIAFLSIFPHFGRMYHKLAIFIALSILSGITSSLWAESLDYRGLYRQTAPAVVCIVGSGNGPSKLGSTGTGSIIRSDGLVVTNAHVIIDKTTGQPWARLVVYSKPTKVTGTRKDYQHPHTADVIAYDEQLDLALLKISGSLDGTTVLPFGPAEAVEVGEPTIAIGHPEQGVLWTMTTGQIGGIIEDFDGVAGRHIFQTETSLNRGNSGGPLIDSSGRMIGVNTMIARQAKDGMAITGINFALRSDVVERFLAAKGEKLPGVMASTTATPQRVIQPPATSPTSPVKPAPDSFRTAAPAQTGLQPQQEMPIRPLDSESTRPARSDSLEFGQSQSKPLSPAEQQRQRMQSAFAELDQRSRELEDSAKATDGKSGQRKPQLDLPYPPGTVFTEESLNQVQKRAKAAFKALDRETTLFESTIGSKTQVPSEKAKE